MGRTSSFEEWLSSPTPDLLTLGDFQVQSRKSPALYEATVRAVTRYRSGVHEYLLVQARVPMPNTQGARVVYLRLERNPTQKGLRILSGKSSQAADTVQMNFSLDLLHTNCESRGQLLFNEEDRPPQVLKLKDILEMYEYLVRASSSYSLLGANCRWLCYGLLECLRQCKGCYGGVWMGGRAEGIQKQDVATANQAKTQYLMEKHRQCCYGRPNTVFGMLMEEAANLGAMATNLADMAGQVQSGQPQNATDPNVIYATTGPDTSAPTTPSATSAETNTQQFQPPNSPPLQAGPQDIPAPIRQATMSHNGTPQFSHLPNQQNYPQGPRQSNPRPSHRPVSSVFTQHSYDAHTPGPAHPAGPRGHPHHGGPNAVGYSDSLPERDSSFCPCDACTYPPRFSGASNYHHPQQRQPSYTQVHQGEIYHQQSTAEGIQHQQGHPPRPRRHNNPTAAGALYNIPEAQYGAAPGDDHNWPPQRNATYQPTPVNHGYSNYQPPPVPVRQYTSSSINTAHMHGVSDGFVEPPYHDLGSLPVRNGPPAFPQAQPRPQAAQAYTYPQTHSQSHPQPRPRPTRWFTHDDSGYPTRTESPEPVGQATADTMRPDDSYQRPALGGHMTMPGPHYY